MKIENIEIVRGPVSVSKWRNEGGGGLFYPDVDIALDKTLEKIISNNGIVEDIKVNHYTVDRHNNGGCDEVWVITNVLDARAIIINEINYIEEINLDHDAGDEWAYGGDYIEILTWLEKLCHYANFKIPDTCIFKFHSANPIGVQNMKLICKANGWRYE